MVNLRLPVHVLHVDDDLDFLEISKEILKDVGGFEVEVALSVDEAFEKLEAGCFDVVVSDYEMPVQSGLDFLKALKSKGLGVPFILFTGKGREEVAIKALNLGADGYHNKQGSPETVYGELSHTITNSVKKVSAENALRESEERFRVFFENGPVYNYMVSPSGILLDINNYALECLGYTKEELVGKPISKLYTPSSKEKIKGLINEFQKSVSIRDAELTVVTKSGEERVVLLNVNGFYDRKGNLLHSISIQKDITPRKKAETELKENLQRWATTLSSIGDAVIVTNVEGRVTFMNYVAETLTGWRLSEAANKPLTQVFNIINEQTLVGIENPVDIVLKTGVVVGLANHTLLIQKGGVEIPIDDSGAPIRDKDGQVTGVVLVFRDVTEQRRHENELSGMLQGVRDVLSAENFPVVARSIFDTCKGLVGAKAGYVALLSDDGAENKVLFLDSGGLGCTVDSRLPMPIRGLRETAYKSGKVVYENDFSASKWIQFMPSGHVQLNNVMFVPLVINGEVVGLMGLANKSSDFTERDALVAAGFGDYAAIALHNSWKFASAEKHRQHVDMLNEKLRVVGSITRHDVANKLSIIQSSLFLIKKEIGDYPELAKYFKQIEVAIETSNRFFEFSRLYEQIGSEEVSAVNVDACFKQAVALVPDLGKIIVVNETERLFAVADSLLVQLFYNLLDNSIRHGKKVTRIKLHYTSQAGHTLLVYEDDGVGIPDSVKGKIFDNGFSTVKSSGLGLYLVSKILEFYGWSIAEEGKLGGGAKFVITIPSQKIVQASQVKESIGTLAPDFW